MRSLVFCLLCIFNVFGANSMALTLNTPSGYVSEATVYSAGGNIIRPVTIVFLHGKSAPADASWLTSLYSTLNGTGYRVIAPQMPWGKWDGTLQQGLEVIDAAVQTAAKDGHMVVVAGHSAGGLGVILYRPSDPPTALVGKAMFDVGHLLDTSSPKFQAQYDEPVMLARQLKTAGKGKETDRFTAVNTKGTKRYEETLVTTPEIFLSYHDLETFPSTNAALGQTRIPVFWAIAKRSTIGNNKRPTFDQIPERKENVFLEVDADHNTMTDRSAEEFIKWLDQLSSKP